MIIAIDLGNYNLKSSESFMALSTFKKHSNINPLNEEILEIGGIAYAMDTVCPFEYHYNKTNRNYLPNLLYTIIKSTDDTEIDLVLNLPIDNLGASETYKKDLTNKEFEFKFNGEDKKIKINRVAVVLESVGAFYTIPKKIRDANDVMVIDIGGRTTNVCTFHKNKIHDKRTITIGMIDFYNTVTTRHNFLGNNLKTENAKNYIEKKLVDVNHDDEIAFIKSIFNEIESFADVAFYDVYASGGGSVTLNDTLLELCPKIKFIDNPLFANVNGNKIIASTQWKK